MVLFSRRARMWYIMAWFYLLFAAYARWDDRIPNVLVFVSSKWLFRLEAEINGSTLVAISFMPTWIPDYSHAQTFSF